MWTEVETTEETGEQVAGNLLRIVTELWEGSPNFPSHLPHARMHTHVLPAEFLHLCQKHGEWPGSEQAVNWQQELNDSGIVTITRRRHCSQVMIHDSWSFTEEVNAALLLNHSVEQNLSLRVIPLDVAAGQTRPFQLLGKTFPNYMDKAALPTHVPPMSYSDAATLLPLLWKWLHRGRPRMGQSAFPASLYLPVGCKYYHLVCVLWSEKVWETLPSVKIHRNSNIYITCVISCSLKQDHQDLMCCVVLQIHFLKVRC